MGTLAFALIFALTFALTFALLTASAAAQTIYLKNGGAIRGEHVREANGRVLYEVGDNSFSLPRALVDHIAESTAGTALFGSAESGKAATAAAVPVPVVVLEPEAADLRSRFIHDGTIDATALANVESTDPELAPLAYDTAGLFAQEHGALERAAQYFRRGLALAPNAAPLVAHNAALLLQSNRYAEALPWAERAARLAPNSADVPM